MRTFLVIQNPDSLAEPENARVIAPGLVMTELGLVAWGTELLGVDASQGFRRIAEGLRARGYGIFALPTRCVRHDAPETEAVGAVVNGFPVLVMTRTDGKGDARVRWTGDDGGNREVELPRPLASALLEIGEPFPDDNSAEDRLRLPDKLPGAPEGGDTGEEPSE